MSNIEFVQKAANEERVHRELHGAAAALPYLRVLEKAVRMLKIEDAFEDATFNKHGLAEGGPFEVRS